MTRYALLLFALLLVGCNRNRADEIDEEPMTETSEGGGGVTERPKEVHKVNLRFVYNMCNDVKDIREFYEGACGMKVNAFVDKPEFGWVTFKTEGAEFMFFRSDEKLPVNGEFAFTPGDGGGPRAATTWSIEVQEHDFRATVKRLKHGQYKSLTPNPTWRQNSYWGFTVLDPMGNTVEVYCTVKDKPKSTEWKE